MGRAPCCDKNGQKKGPWTPEEDHKLITYIQTHGSGNWRNLPKNAGLQRCGKSCRLRWTNYLRPDIKRGRFSFEEEETIIQLHSILGNKWSAIAARLPGRTDNEIKNYWNTHIRKRLLRNGIDPVTHAPRLDLLDLSSLLTSALCNPSSLFNLSNLVTTQAALLNPDLLRLAATLSSLKQENPGLLPQHLQENQLCNSLLSQLPVSQPSSCQIPTSSTTPFPSQTQLEGFSSDPTNVNGPHNFQGNPNYAYCNTNNPASAGAFPTYNNKQNLGMDSVLSTPLNSSSTFVSSSTEDERESYCSSLLKFEIPESLDLEDFM